MELSQELRLSTNDFFNRLYDAWSNDKDSSALHRASLQVTTRVVTLIGLEYPSNMLFRQRQPYWMRTSLLDEEVEKALRLEWSEFPSELMSRIYFHENSLRALMGLWAATVSRDE